MAETPMDSVLEVIVRGCVLGFVDKSPSNCDMPGPKAMVTGPDPKMRGVTVIVPAGVADRLSVPAVALVMPI